MEIAFPQDAPQYSARNLTVVFLVLVDERPVHCAITVEALEDHFKVESTDEVGWINAFLAGRSQINDTLREHLRLSDGAPVLLKSGHFPARRALA